MAFTSVFLVLVGGGTWTGFWIGKKVIKRWDSGRKTRKIANLIFPISGGILGLGVLVLVIVLTA